MESSIETPLSQCLLKISKLPLILTLDFSSLATGIIYLCIMGGRPMYSQGQEIFFLLMPFYIIVSIFFGCFNCYCQYKNFMICRIIIRGILFLVLTYSATKMISFTSVFILLGPILYILLISTEIVYNKEMEKLEQNMNEMALN